MEQVIKDVNVEYGTSFNMNFDFDKTVDELYGFLLAKLSISAASECNEVFDRNGLDVFRLINRSTDVTYKMTEFEMEGEVTNLGAKKAKDISDTKNLLKEIIAKSRDFREKIGSEMRNRDLARTLWKGKDATTQDIAQLQGLGAGGSHSRVEGLHQRPI